MKSAYIKTALLFVGAVFSLWLPAGPSDPPQADLPTCEKIDSIRKSSDVPLPQKKAILLGFVNTLEQQKIQDSTLAFALHGLGGVYKADEKLDSAIIYTKRATGIWTAILQSGHAAKMDSIRAGGSFYNLGSFYKDDKQPHAARHEFESAIAMYRKVAPEKISFVYRDMGNVLDQMGDYFEAKIYFTEAIRAAIESGNEGYLAQAYLDMSNSLNYQGAYLAALDTAKKALPLLEQTGEIERNRFVCFQNIGNAYDYLAQYDSAIVYFKGALRLELDTAVKCNILNLLGISYRKKKDFKSAKAVLYQALEWAKKEKLTDEQATTFDNLGEVFLAENQLKLALQYFRQAQKLVQEEAGNSDITNIQGKSDLLTYLYDEGKTLCLLSHPDSLKLAISRFEKADTLVDLLRQEPKREESNLVWRKHTTEMYEQALSACYRLGNTEKAFFFLEKSKSVLLSDALAGLSAGSILGPSLDSLIFKLQSDLKMARQNYEPGNTWLDSIRVRQDTLNKYLKIVSDSFPEYARIKYHTETISLQSAQTNLDDSTCLIQYFYGDSSLYILGVYKNAPPKIIQIKNDSLLKSDLSLFASFFGKNKKVLSEDQQTYLDLATRIFETILKPILPPVCKKVIIAPDGPLNFIPFDALLTANWHWDPGVGYAGAPYLLNTLQTRLAWSATILWRFQSKPGADAVENARLGLFAPGTFPGAGLPDLDTLDLIKNIQKILGKSAVQTFTGKAASSENFWQSRTSFSIFHFHTHATVDALAAPRLYFYNDSISIDEFYRKRIVANLFVLGACETSLGADQRGEGVYSLSRALAGAGVPSVISSLWEVSGDASPDLFAYFYEELRNGKTKADALYLAKKHYLSAHAGMAQSAPDTWAAWTFAGRDNVILLVPSDRDFLAYWWITGLALVAFLLFWRFRKKSNR